MSNHTTQPAEQANPPAERKYVILLWVDWVEKYKPITNPLGANYWPSWMASLHNPNRCGILDALVVGTPETLKRDYPEALRKVRPDLFEMEAA